MIVFIHWRVSSSLLIVHSGFKLVARWHGSQKKAHGVKMAAMFSGRPCLCVFVFFLPCSKFTGKNMF